MKTEELMTIAVKAGEILLKSGAEIYRVEDTITRIFGAYGVPCECFILLTCIILSAPDENGNSHTVVRRLRGHTIDLHRIELVNSFSRSLQSNPLSFEVAQKVLTEIEKKPPLDFLPRLLIAGAMTFVYSLFFQGSLKDAIAAFLIGLMVYSAKDGLTRAGFFQFFEYFVSGILAGGLSFTTFLAFPGLDVYKVIIGPLMLLVPGVSITNGLKDALYGDTVSSLYRVSEAIFISVAVAAGVGLSFAVGLNLQTRT